MCDAALTESLNPRIWTADTVSVGTPDMLREHALSNLTTTEKEGEESQAESGVR
jgi:hypothetical protein